MGDQRPVPGDAAGIIEQFVEGVNRGKVPHSAKVAEPARARAPKVPIPVLVDNGSSMRRTVSADDSWDHRRYGTMHRLIADRSGDVLGPLRPSTNVPR